MSKSYFVYAVMMMFSCVVSVGYAGNKPLHQSDSSQFIVELSKKKWSWVIENQLDSLTNLFSDNFQAIQPKSMMDKLGYLDLIENTNIRYRDIAILESSIRVDGDVSTLITKSEFIAKKDTRASQINCVTEVYKRSAKGWKLILLQIHPLNGITFNND